MDISISHGGALVVDKPTGLTSHDVVSRVRRMTGLKTGHTGTLDPAATGVLPLLLGRATRLSRFYSGQDKEYSAVIRLGLVTDTYDLEGEVKERHEVGNFSRAEIEERCQAFLGEIVQTVPAYSAVKVGGKRLYKMARRGERVSPPSRRVTVSSLEIGEVKDERIKVKIACSAGTYIRSIAHDLGQALGCGGVLERLRRTRSGEFTLEQAVPLDELESKWEECLVPLDRLAPHLAAVELDRESSTRLLHGQEVESKGEDGTARVFCEKRLLAVAKRVEDRLRPETNLLRPEEL